MKKDKQQESGSKKVSRFPRIYILDVVIILLVVAIGLGIYFRYSVFDMLGNSKNQVDAVVSFSIKNIKDTTGYYIDIGDRVYFESNGDTLGTVMESSENSEHALNESPAVETLFEDGEYITVTYPGGKRIDAKGRLLCRGIFAEDGTFRLGGTEYIAPGQSFTVCTEKVTVNITVIDIQAQGD